MSLSICVIGTVFLDCKGFSLHKYNPSGRNLGNVSFIHGGVGRNVAENLANLSLPVTFISSVDNSAIGNNVVERLKSRQINTLYVLKSEKNNGMGIWLAILDENGDLAGSISMMPDLSLLEKLIPEKGNQIINNSSHVILELDLNEKIARNVIKISRKLGKPVFGIPGNLDVVLNNVDILQHLECFICNEIEAGQIIGVELTKLEIAQKKDCLADMLLAKEAVPRHMVVTMGNQGSIYCDSANKVIGHQPAIPTAVVDTSGAGDAFFSGSVMGLIRKFPLRQAVVFGTRMASWTIQSNENICPDLGGKIRQKKLMDI